MSPENCKVLSFFLQEAHEAVYEVHQDQEQMQAHRTADLAHQEQVSCLLNNLHDTYNVSLCKTGMCKPS